MASRVPFLPIAAIALLFVFGGVLLAVQFPSPRLIDTPVSIEQPADTLPLADLLQQSYALAAAYGLETIESQDYAWVTLGDHFGEIGLVQGISDPQTPLLVVAMRGSGTWAGAGFVPPDFRIDGVTLSLNGHSGHVVSATGGYAPPTGVLTAEYQQILDYPTIAPIVPILLEQTRDATSPD